MTLKSRSKVTGNRTIG